MRIERVSVLISFLEGVIVVILLRARVKGVDFLFFLWLLDNLVI